MIKTFFKFLVLVIGALALLITFRTGPITRPLQTVDDLPLARADAMTGVTCKERTIPVKLNADAWFTHDVVGQLCWTGELDGKTLAVTVSGGGYSSHYWDFPYQPDTYSFGSTISLAHALTYPDNVDGIVLTGFVHNSNPGFQMAVRTGIHLAAFKGRFAGSLLDPTYIISKPGTRLDMFYTRDNVDPQVVAIDELNAETTTIGEVISMPKYFKEQSRDLKVPVFTLIGEDDFVVCGGAVECTDHDAIKAWEAEFFAPPACHEITVLKDTNHNANLHLNAPENFRLMLDWIERRVGNAGPPSEICAAGQAA